MRSRFSRGAARAALVLFVLTSTLAVPVARAQDDMVETTAVIEEAAEPAAKPWAALTADEKLDLLQSAALAAGEDGVVTSKLFDDVNTLWTCLAAFLVFFMQAGFCLVETGFTRAKNACNIVMKNLVDFSIGSLAFWAIGFGVMFGTATGAGLFGTDNFFFEADDSFNWAFFIFQTVFAATAATIVSGAMAERTKFSAYVIYSAAITILVYPVFGCMAWNSLGPGDSSGWLENRGFLDFAGSTVVHSIGGWAALAGAIVLGPRLGRYVKGKVNPIPGHNIPMAALGVFILWLGWFGFNPGSTTAVNEGSFAFIAVTTNIAAAAGVVGGMVASWVLFKKPDPSFALNGALAGLVAITAGCNVIPVPYAALTGLIAGVLVVFSVMFFDKIRVDDPVGAISVHGCCGAWGTLAVGLFGAEVGLLTGGGTAQLVTQALGVGLGFAWAFSVSLAIFFLLKVTIGLRVTAEEELEGLDIKEHGMLAYPPHFTVDPLAIGVSRGSTEPSVAAGVAPVTT